MGEVAMGRIDLYKIVVHRVDPPNPPGGFNRRKLRLLD